MEEIVRYGTRLCKTPNPQDLTHTQRNRCSEKTPYVGRLFIGTFIDVHFPIVTDYDVWPEKVVPRALAGRYVRVEADRLIALIPAQT